MQCLPRSVVVLLVLVGALWSRFGQCDTRQTVAFIRTPGQDAFFSRLEAEIHIAGFDTTELADVDVPNDTEIEIQLKRYTALLFTRQLSRTVELYYRTRDGRLLHMVMPSPMGNEEEQVTALQIAEVLRVTYFSQARTPLTTVQRPAPQKKSPSSLIANELMVQLGGNLLWGVHDAYPQLGTHVEAGLRWQRLFFVSLSVQAPLRGVRLNFAEGNARFYLGSIGLNTGVMAPTGRFRIMIRLGYQLWLLGATTSAENGFAANSDVRISSGPSLFAGGVLVLPNNRIGISIGGSFIVHTAKTEYVVAARRIATIGYLLPGIALGLMWLPGTER